MKILISLLLIFFFPCTSILSQQIGAIEWTDCFLDDCSLIEGQKKVEFGYLTVPENYDTPNSRLLKIAFAIIRSNADQPKPDPVIMFQGGWGAPMLESIPFQINHFLGADRDLILYDYRGCGYSEPVLCDWMGEQVYKNLLADHSSDEMRKKQISLMSNCLDSLSLKDIDFNQYGTNNKSRDATLLAE